MGRVIDMTSLKQLITAPLSRFVASQLRKPSGLLAKRIGKEMNLSNEAVYALTLSTIQPSDGDSILEIGFGNGKFFPDLIPKANDLNVYGLDISPKMVEEARSRNPETVASGQLDLYLGSSDKMAFWDATFDHIFCINVVYFWDSPDDHLSEIHRVLKPGGRFYMGIKSKANFSKMRFTKHRFTLYGEKDLVDVLERNRFRIADIVAEKSTDVRGDAICIVSEKI